MACKFCGKRLFAKAADAAASTTSLAYALTGGQASLDQMAARQVACAACAAVDTKGERLFRTVNGRTFCGQPRASNVFRESKKDGCGCGLASKWTRRLASCPLGKW